MSAPLRISGWLALIAAVAAGEYGWVVTNRRSMPSWGEPVTGGVVTHARTLDLEAPAELPEPSVWEAPPLQPRGPEWRYEVFAPPVLQRSPETWIWSPPASSPPIPEAKAEPPFQAEFGIEVEAIVREPFPVQLVGFGRTADGMCLGIFENAGSGDTMIVRAEDLIDGTDYAVESIEIARSGAATADEGALHLIRAEAVVKCRSTGDRIKLTTLQRTYVGEPWIRYRSTGGPVKEAAGGAHLLETDAGVYRVESLQLAEVSGVVDVLKEGLPGDKPGSRQFVVPLIDSFRLGPGENSRSAPENLIFADVSGSRGGAL